MNVLNFMAGRLRFGSSHPDYTLDSTKKPKIEDNGNIVVTLYWRLKRAVARRLMSREA